MMALMELQGKIVVVTGAGRGLGRCIADTLADQGATVYMCGIRPDESPKFSVVDVRDAAAVQEFIDGIVAEHGHIDILINNAGWVDVPKPLEEESDTDYRKCMSTNVDGVFHFMRAVLPAMKDADEGLILNIGSRAGRRAHPTLAVYSASKFAVRGMSQAVAKLLDETEDGKVRCIVIGPGGIDTPMRQKLFGEEESSQQQSPEEVAAIITSVIKRETEIPNGAHVEIVGGEIVGVYEMD